MRLLPFLFVILISAALPAMADEPFLDIQKVKSEKGDIEAWLVEDHSLPVISLQFAFKGAGSIRDNLDKQGTAQLLSNTMDEGAGKLTSQEFQKQLSDHSISLTFSSSRDNFGGQLKTLSRHQDKAFELLSLALNKPRFDEEPVGRMRDANLSRIRRAMSQPDWIAARLFNDIIYEGHPYALNSGGTLSSLPKITAKDLKNFKQEWLTRDRLHIGVTGDITAKKLKEVIDQIFSDLPIATDKKLIADIEPKHDNKTYVYHKDIPQSIISIGMPTLDKNDPDYYTLQVMNFIFGSSGFGSRLMEEAREKRGLTYGIYSGLRLNDHANVMTISASTKNESAREILDIVGDEMLNMRNAPVTKTELEDAKSYLIGSLPLSLTSTDNIAGMLLGLQLDERPADYLDHYEEKIQAVSAKDIQSLAKRLLNSENTTTIIVGKPENIENTIARDTLPNVE